MPPKRKTHRPQITEYEPVKPVFWPPVSISREPRDPIHQKRCIYWGSEYVKLPRPTYPKFANKRILAYRYGLSLEEVLRIWEDQGRACGICKKHTNKPCIDHCHATGKVRGILCYGYNTALGKFKDSAYLLQSAINYLKR